MVKDQPKKIFKEVDPGTGKVPIIPLATPPRSFTVVDELAALRVDWQQHPDQRWHIEKRANILTHALEKHPEWKLENNIIKTLF